VAQDGSTGEPRAGDRSHAVSAHGGRKIRFVSFPHHTLISYLFEVPWLGLVRAPERKPCVRDAYPGTFIVPSRITQRWVLPLIGAGNCSTR
jgi:hypothetical protein